MGKIMLVARLAVRDIRRHKARPDRSRMPSLRGRARFFPRPRYSSSFHASAPV
jgi:hypothetical protein